MKQLIAAVALSLAALHTPQAFALDIVNSGPTDGSLSGTYNNGPADYQSFARLISLDRAYTITDISGFFEVQRAGQLQVSVYSDTRSIPSDLLFSATTTVASQTDSADWIGVHGLAWTLGPGNYWVAFSGDEGGFHGYSPSYSNVDHPLAISHINHFYTDWFRHGEGSNQDLALWVQGDIATVPEPGSASLLLIGGGLVLAAARRRKPAV